MKKKYNNLSIYLRTVILSSLVLTIISALFIPFYFFNFYDIPVGVIIGGILSIFCYFLLGIAEKKDENHKKMQLTVAIIIIRFIILTVALFGFGYLSYRLNIKVANIFAIIGAYFVPTIVFTIYYLRERR